LRIWKTMVRPMMEYAAEVWGDCVWGEAEKIQIQMGKRILGCRQKTADDVILGELGWWRMRGRRDMLRLRYWGKIMRMSNDRWVKKIYRMTRREYERNGSKNWCEATHELVKELGLEEVWERDSVDGLEGWNDRVEAAIGEREEREWKKRMSKTKMLRNYVKLKDELKCEEYLTCGGSRRDKINMIELRGGMNGLEINKGRREGKSIGERVCRCCGWEVEDEKHFMLRCEEFDSDRMSMMSEMEELCDVGCSMMQIVEGNEDKMMDLMIGRGIEGKYEEGMSIVQRFVRKSMRKRKERVG
jgi:hypothetical protein